MSFNWAVAAGLFLLVLAANFAAGTDFEMYTDMENAVYKGMIEEGFKSITERGINDSCDDRRVCMRYTEDFRFVWEYPDGTNVTLETSTYSDIDYNDAKISAIVAYFFYDLNGLTPTQKEVVNASARFHLDKQVEDPYNRTQVETGIYNWDNNVLSITLKTEFQEFGQFAPQCRELAQTLEKFEAALKCDGIDLSRRRNVYW